MGEQEPEWGRTGRRQRRETARQLAKEILQNRLEDKGNPKLDVALWFLTAFMALGLPLVAPKIGRGLTVVVVVAMGLCLVHPLWQLPWVQRGSSWSSKGGRFCVTLLIAVVTLVPFAIYVWPPIRRHVLSDDEKGRFEEPLKQQVEDRYEIVLACPTADEPTCIYAAQFINLFREAGWKVRSNQVQRVTLGIPYEGIRIFAYVDTLPEPDAPVNSGVWTKVSASLITAYRSFHAISIEPEEGIRNDEKENVLTVYFGSERPDEGTPTQLTKMYGRLPEVKRVHPEVKLP